MVSSRLFTYLIRRAQAVPLAGWWGIVKVYPLPSACDDLPAPLTCWWSLAGCAVQGDAAVACGEGNRPHPRQALPCESQAYIDDISSRWL